MGSYEPPGRKTQRYAALLAHLLAANADVVTVNEALPVKSFTRRLAADLGFDATWHVGCTGIGACRAPPTGHARAWLGYTS